MLFDRIEIKRYFYARFLFWEVSQSEKSYNANYSGRGATLRQLILGN